MVIQNSIPSRITIDTVSDSIINDNTKESHNVYAIIENGVNDYNKIIDIENENYINGIILKNENSIMMINSMAYYNKYKLDGEYININNDYLEASMMNIDANILERKEGNGIHIKPTTNSPLSSKIETNSTN